MPSPNDTHIIDTVDEWEKKEQELRQEEMRRADERSRERWEDIKKALKFVAAVLFFPLLPIYFWWEKYKDRHFEEVDKVGSMLVLVLFYTLMALATRCYLEPGVAEKFAMCVDQWDEEPCLKVLKACPSLRKKTIKQCYESCPCKTTQKQTDLISNKETTKCDERDANCMAHCLNQHSFDAEDALLARCASNVSMDVCESLFEHCGSL